MPYMMDNRGPSVANARLPWEAEIPPSTQVAAMADWHQRPEKAVGYFQYSLNLFFEAVRQKNHLLAIETMVGALETLVALSKSGLVRSQIADVGLSLGVDLDFNAFQELVEAYFYELLEGSIGAWNPNEIAYRRYLRLRDCLYNKPAQLPAGSPIVNMPDMQNENRLRVAPVKRQIRNVPRTQTTPPATNRFQVAPAGRGFSSFWGVRKIIGPTPMRRATRGNIIQAHF